MDDATRNTQQATGHTQRPVLGLRSSAHVGRVGAAHAAGLTDVVLPERNRGDLDDVPEEVRDAMKFHLAMTVDEVLGVALEPAQLVAAA